MAERPSDVSKLAMTALINSLELASVFAAATAELLAKASLSVPHRPLGSAADTAIPANITLSEILVHSSGVKFCLFAMAASYGSKAEQNTAVGADGINSILVSSV